MATITFLYRSTRKEGPLSVRITFRLKSAEPKPGFKDVYAVKRKNGPDISEETMNKNKERYIKDVILICATKIQVDEYFYKKLYHSKAKDSIIQKKQEELRRQENDLRIYLTEHVEKYPLEALTTEWLKKVTSDYYQPKHNKKEIPITLLDFIDYYDEVKKDELTESSIKKHRVVKNKLERYEKARGKIILISEVDENFKSDFVDYCKSENYALGTIKRDLVFIKTFCNYAFEKGLEVSRELNKVKIKVKTEIKHPYLTFAELDQIERKEFNDSMDNVRDWLLVSCYTAQRVSDFMNFRSEMIREENGKYLLEFKQKKTGKLMTIPVHPKVLQILKKRNGEFPRPLSDQKYNDILKLVCKEAGIIEKINGSKKVEIEPNSGIYRKEEGIYEKWELMSSHVGRRSFASNHYGRIPTSYLIYITGHSSEKIFLTYIGKSEKDLAIDIANYF